MLTIDTTILKKEIKTRQTVIDFTVQNCGTMEALFDVAVLNGVSPTDPVAPGTVLLAPVIELKVVSFYGKNKELDITTDDRILPIPGGIGFMQIGTSFKVS